MHDRLLYASALGLLAAHWNLLMCVHKVYVWFLGINYRQIAELFQGLWLTSDINKGVKEALHKDFSIFIRVLIHSLNAMNVDLMYSMIWWIFIDDNKRSGKKNRGSVYILYVCVYIHIHIHVCIYILNMQWCCQDSITTTSYKKIIIYIYLKLYWTLVLYSKLNYCLVFILLWNGDSLHPILNGIYYFF